jgi:hypothetical protein
MAGWKFRGVTDALRRVEEYEKGQKRKPSHPLRLLESLLIFSII